MGPEKVDKKLFSRPYNYPDEISPITPNLRSERHCKSSLDLFRRVNPLTFYVHVLCADCHNSNIMIWVNWRTMVMNEESKSFCNIHCTSAGFTIVLTRVFVCVFRVIEVWWNFSLLECWFCTRWWADKQEIRQMYILPLASGYWRRDVEQGGVVELTDKAGVSTRISAQYFLLQIKLIFCFLFFNSLCPEKN